MPYINRMQSKIREFPNQRLVKDFERCNQRRYYLSDGEIIPVVHNAGGKKMWRPIDDFGYGYGHNVPRPMVIFFLRTFYKSLSLFRKFVRIFEKR